MSIKHNKTELLNITNESFKRIGGNDFLLINNNFREVSIWVINNNFREVSIWVISNDPNTYFPEIIINQQKIIPTNSFKYL